MEKLTIQEEKAMKLVWKKGEGTIRDYFLLGEDKELPYTTFASAIRNLAAKGYLTMRRIGTTYLCRPLIAEDEYKSRFISGFIRDYFKNSYKEMVSFFAEEEKISAEDLQDIINIIEKKK